MPRSDIPGVLAHSSRCFLPPDYPRTGAVLSWDETATKALLDSGGMSSAEYAAAASVSSRGPLDEEQDAGTMLRYR